MSTPPPPLPRPSVTVAICTYNRARLLAQTLDQLAHLQVPPSVCWEVVVIDNASTDATASVLERQAPVLGARTFFESRKGLAHARNRAAAEARNDWILFTDDDVRIAPDWVERLVLAVERHPEASIAGGPIVPWFPVEPDRVLLDVFPELQRGFCGIDHGQSEGWLGDRLEVYGANFAVRRSLFERFQFDTALGVPYSLGEETDFVKRARGAGARVLWVPSMPVQHYVDPSRMTLAYLRGYRRTLGSTQVRQEGLPAATGLFGAPRWLLRKYLGASLRSAAWRALGQRKRALEHLREGSYYRGMLTEARAAARRPAAGRAPVLPRQDSRP